VHDDSGSTPPISQQAASGASDPMAISLEPFERQFADFADAIRTGRTPAVSGRDGLLALEVVDAIYRACRTGERQSLTGA
jgi:predicted dehydrogenase